MRRHQLPGGFKAFVRLALFLCPLALGLAVAAQEPTRPPKFESGTTEVEVDVVVSNRSGPVTDLQPSDFEVFEDGARQAHRVVGIPSSRVDQSPTAQGGIPTNGATSSGSIPKVGEPPPLVALVFDRLSAEARALAWKSAKAYVDVSEPGAIMGVFLIDLSLDTVQRFTGERSQVLTALDVVARRPTSRFDRSATAGTSVRSEQARRGVGQAGGDSDPSVAVTAGAEFAGRPVDTRGKTVDEATMEGLDLTFHNTWEILARDQQGYATTNALRALAAGLRNLPGRKTVIFFGEGLAIPTAVMPHFDRAIAEANLARITVYSVDAAGLRVHSADAATAREVGAMAAASRGVSPDGGNYSSLAMMERNEDVLQKDARTSLRLLAERTGGLLIDNTNDLLPRLRLIDSDRRATYLLAYASTNSDAKGGWRSIKVKVKRRGVTVRSRAGYLAAEAGQGKK